MIGRTKKNPNETTVIEQLRNNNVTYLKQIWYTLFYMDYYSWPTSETVRSAGLLLNCFEKKKFITSNDKHYSL